jgi:predicted phosphodiesterase/sugar phosphate isomerase/epimerase
MHANGFSHRGVTGTPAGVRFAVICDIHLERSGDLQSRYFEEALRQVSKAAPDFLVVLGDLTARGGEEALAAVAAAAKKLPIKTYFLPGNSDIRDSSLETYRRIFGEPRFCFRMEDILFLGVDTSEPEIKVEQREWIQRQTGEAEMRRFVVFTHIPPRKLSQDSRAFLEKVISEPRALLCVAGHSHRPMICSIGHCPVFELVGVDPFKPVAAQPGFELFCVERGVRAEGRTISLLSKTQIESVFDRLGAAPRGFEKPEQLVELLQRERLRHVQLNIKQEVPCGPSGALERWRSQTPGATVSVHLRTPSLDGAGRLSNRVELQKEIEAALGHEAVSATLHLPKIDSKLVLDEQGKLRANEFTQNMMRDLVEVLRPLLDRRVGIHLENLRWRGEGLENERSLGTVPPHLLAFRDALAERTEGAGFRNAEVGFTLDIGHVWGNGALAKPYPAYKWFEALSPHILSVHLHDTVPREGKQINHQPIGSEGGMVGLEGTFYLLTHLAAKAVIYLEMLNLPDTALSLARIREWAKGQ